MVNGTNNYSLSDIAAVSGNNNGFGWGDGGWFIWIILIFAIFGGWGNGFGYGGNSGGQIGDNYVLASDFATIQRQLSDGFSSIERKGDTINAGLCDGFYAQNTTMLNGFNNLSQGIANSTYNLTNSIQQNGYETRNAITQAQIAEMQSFNGVNAAIKDCCCQTQQNIKDAVTQGVFNTNTLQGAIKDSACANEKAVMQNRFDMAQYNCSTLQAIDKLGDRIIERMNLSESQAKDAKIAEQAAYISNLQLRQGIRDDILPVAKPAYITCSPYASAYGNGYGCGCSGCCNG